MGQTTHSQRMRILERIENLKLSEGAEDALYTFSDHLSLDQLDAVVKALKLVNVGTPPTLTPKQLEILKFIRDYWQDNEVSPTLQEIADHFGTSKITTYEHVLELERRGAITRQPNRARTMVIRPEVLAWLNNGGQQEKAAA